MVKDILQIKRDEGKAIIMSTHQMNQVEELCDRILLIDYGHRVLYGTLQEIQEKFSSRDIMVTPLSDLPQTIEGVREIKKMNSRFRLILEENAKPNVILRDLINSGVELTEFEIAVPPLNEIFIKVVKEKAGGAND
jgi:ABC-2 type transport system ATP-binding protein